MFILTWGIDILFQKLVAEIGGWIWKIPLHATPLGWVFHAKPVFLFDIFSGELLFGALIIGLCYICQIIGQTIGEGAI